jgi:hypothetical protein
MAIAVCPGTGAAPGLPFVAANATNASANSSEQNAISRRIGGRRFESSDDVTDRAGA